MILGFLGRLMKAVAKVRGGEAGYVKLTKAVFAKVQSGTMRV